MIVPQPPIPVMAPSAVDLVRRLEAEAMKLPEQAKAKIFTQHTIHGGMYARTIMIPAGVMITSVLVRLPTMLIIQGKAVAYVGTDEPLQLNGHHVLPASAGRKQVFIALEDTHITAVFPTAARTVEDAEREFSDEADILLSRLDPDLNDVVITEE